MADETANEVGTTEGAESTDEKILKSIELGELALEKVEDEPSEPITESDEPKKFTINGREMTESEIAEALRDSENKKEWQKKQTERDQELARKRKELDKELASLRDSVKGDEGLERIVDNYGNTSKEVADLKEKYAELVRTQEYEKSRSEIVRMKQEAESELGYSLGKSIDDPNFKAYVEYVQNSNPILLAGKLMGQPKNSDVPPKNLNDHSEDGKGIDYSPTRARAKELGIKNIEAFLRK